MGLGAKVRGALAATLLMGSSIAFAAPCAAEAAPAALPRKPNVIVIVADDLGWSDVSTYGLKRVATPNIDKLAHQGVAFSNGYAVASVCSVSRAGLLTGRYPQKFGNEYLTPGDTAKHGLAIDQPTIANYMRTAGYHTGAIGKWHEGVVPGYQPLQRGFDDFWGFLGDRTSYEDPANPDVVSGAPGGAPPAEPQRSPVEQIITGPNNEVVHNFEKYSTYEFADQASDFIERNAKNPFFLYLAFNAPHRPFQAPKAVYDRLTNIKDPGRRLYVAQIVALDEGVGRVERTLKKLGLADNTMVVFVSDNGCPAQFGLCDCSSLINAGKFTYLEGGTRIPFIVSWPKGIKRRGIIDIPVSELDILPTALKLAHATPSPKYPLDGHDLLDTIAHPQVQAGRTLYWRQRPIYAVREGRWKLWRSSDLKQIKLYDIVRDPGELHDIAEQRPGLVARLGRKLDDWQSGLSEPAWNKRKLDVVQVCGRWTEEVI